MNNCGMPVIGLGEHSEEYADLPLQWMPHIQVTDISLSVQLALGLGGSEIMHGRDDDGQSQWAVLLDSNGAAFGIIPVISADQVPTQEDGASRDKVSSVGCISRLELTVTNASLMRDFYQTVIGWSVQDAKEQVTSEYSANYNMLKDDGTLVAKIKHARDENQDIPPVWILHLPVNDMVESLRRVREEGGKIIKEKFDRSGVYTHAITLDPVGSVWLWYQDKEVYGFNSIKFGFDIQ